MKTKSPIEKNQYNEVSWQPQPGDSYVVTGVLTNGRRFRPIRTDNWAYANGINLWRGTKWLVRNGKRHVIVRYYN